MTAVWSAVGVDASIYQSSIPDIVKEAISFVVASAAIAADG